MFDSVPDEWREASFASLADYANGRAFKPKDWGEVGLPIVRIAQITNPGAETDFYDGPVEPRHRIDDGDLIFSWSATLAVMRWSGGPAVLNQHLFKVTPAEGIDRDWLQYRLEASIPTLSDEAHGTTMKHIRKGTLISKTTRVPPIDEQRRIAKVLRSVDEVVRSSAEVAHSARNTFNRLIDALHHQNAENTVPLSSICVPKGLQTGPFGSQLKVSDYVDGGIPVVMPSDLKPDGIDFAGAKATSYEKFAQLKQHALEPGDILFSRRGDVEKCGAYLEGDPAALCGTGCLRARIDRRLADPVLIYFLVQSEVCGAWLTKHAVGVTMPNLNTSIIGALPVPNLPKAEQSQWVVALQIAEDVCRVNERLLAELADLKTAVADDLLSGRVRVPA